MLRVLPGAKFVKSKPTRSSMTEPGEPEPGTAALAMAKITGTFTADAGTGRVAGPVYSPVARMVPKVALPLATRLTIHVRGLLEPARLGMNWPPCARTTAAAGCGF